MAFGFGFNKQKVLSAAEKFVQQGKLQNAITEYEKIIKADPKDLTVMNTVGDLYSRLGESDRAIECFKSVGDAYAQQGFTVKAIAMYKKLSKLRPTLEGSLRLAELYTQQGLFNDARAQYLQVAEEFLRGGELEQAVRIFQKTLEMDPENVGMRTRLAEVYIRLGKKAEAWDIFAAAAESLRGRGATTGAEEILQRMLTLDPNNSHALLLSGRLAFDSQDFAGAIKSFEKVADLDNHTDGLNMLMQCYLKVGRTAEAGGLANKLATVHNDATGISTYAEALIAAGKFEDALRVFTEHSDRLLALDSNKILDTLHYLIGHVRENAPALEMLLELLQKAGEQTHITEVYELLAHAYVQSNRFDKARDYYFKLTQLEPQNQLHATNYQQVMSKLGNRATSTPMITAEEGAVLVDEIEATAPFIDQRYADEVALAVRAALTDAELFTSYNMPAKALDPLLAALPRAPKDLRLNQRLAALHTRAGRFAEAAVCCRTLESVYHDAGYPDEATRYGELAARYEERAAPAPAVQLSTPVEAAPEPTFAIETPVEFEPTAQVVEEPAELTIEPELMVTAPEAEPEPEIAVAPPAPVAEVPAPAAPKSGLVWHAPVSAPPAPPVAEAASAEFSVQPEAESKEIDLSDEWEVELSDAPAAPAEEPPAIVVSDEQAAQDNDHAIAETIEEIRFYLKHGMVDQAMAGLAKVEQLKAEPATLIALRAEINAAQAPAVAEQPQVVEEQEFSIEEAPAIEVASAPEPEPTPAPTPAPAPVVAPAQVAQVPVPQKPAAAAAAASAGGNVLGDFVSDLESALGDDFMGGSAAEISAPAAPVAKPVAAAPVAPKPEISIAAAPAPVASVAAAAPAPVAPAAAPTVAAAAGVDLAGMFSELRSELEEGSTSATEEDPETHYNLGVAFREMGLLDEAIGELQKVCQAVERGHAFPQMMQTYTWLAQCFLDKGVPEAAIRWYEQALKLPNLDGEATTALHYELGSSYQIAQNKPAALNHFMQVYGSNIDYRDVAERIKALKS